MGTAAEVFMLKSATNIFPTELIMKGKYYFIGRILQLLEVQSDKLSFKLVEVKRVYPVMTSNHFFTFLSTLKLGIRGEGIKELFGNNIPNFKGDLSFSDFKALFNLVSI